MNTTVCGMNVPPFIWTAVPRRDYMVRLRSLRPALPRVDFPSFDHCGSIFSIFSLQFPVDVIRDGLTMIDFAYLIGQPPPLNAWYIAAGVRFDVTNDCTIVT